MSVLAPMTNDPSRVLVPLMIAVLAYFFRQWRRNAVPVAANEGAWSVVALENGWRFTDPFRIDALVGDVEVTVLAGVWGDGGPSTRIEARLQNPADPKRANDAFDAVRTRIPGLKISRNDALLCAEWDRLEANPRLLKEAILAVAEACRWEPPKVLYR